MNILWRAAVAAVALCLAMGGSAGAQIRTGAGIGGPSVIIRPAPGSRGQDGSCCGRIPGHLRRHPHLSPFVPALFPYPYFDYYPEPTVVQPAPPQVVVIREPAERPAPSAAPAPAPDPQVTEVPPAKPDVRHAATQGKEKQAAVFLLADGRQIRAQRYTITDRFIYVAEARRRTLKIPLEDLNVEATLARNREQGIELRIPSAPGELYLSF